MGICAGDHSPPNIGWTLPLVRSMPLEVEVEDGGLDLFGTALDGRVVLMVAAMSGGFCAGDRMGYSVRHWAITDVWGMKISNDIEGKCPSDPVPRQGQDRRS
jgi:hypothetical protein